MAVLSEIVKNVLVIVLVASFMELMMPEGTLKPFVRFSIGLFILIAVLNPLAGALFADRNLEIQWWDFKISPDQQEKILREGEEVNQQIWNSNQQFLSEKVEGQIGAVATLVPGVDEVKAKVSLDKTGALESLQLVVRPQRMESSKNQGEMGVFSGGKPDLSKKDEEAIRRKLTSVIRNLYGLNDLSIQIEFEGG